MVSPAPRSTLTVIPLRLMTTRHTRGTSVGPFLPEQLRSGDPYEITRGHPVHCLPTGSDGTGPNGRGFIALDTDPMAANAGVDLGMDLGTYTMRAPDIAVGAFAEKGGWVKGALPLAVEYASVGQDEDDLQERIADMLSHGVKYVWVVRLLGPRRVEVHERGVAMRTVLPGQSLTAPGVLQNPVRVEALYDRDAAHEAALQNILQRKGYRNLDAVRDEGREEGLEDGRKEAVALIERQLARRIGRALTDAERATLHARVSASGLGPVGDIVFDLDPPALASWLSLSDAR